MNTSLISLEKVFVEEGLTKEQVDFQRRAAAIEKLKNDYNDLKSRIETSRQQYEVEIDQHKKAFHTKNKARYKMLCDSFLTLKMSKTLRDNLLSVIKLETKTILQVEELKEEIEAIEALFMLCYGKSYDHFENEMMEMATELTNSMFKANLGFSPDEFETQKAFEEEIKERQQGIFGGSPFYTSEKDKKQQQKRIEKEKEKETAEQKSIREIYRNLIKAFHPDREMDETLKIEKTEICKKITEAYKKEDLYSLLYYEFELLGKDKNRLKELASEKLKVYNNILIKQKRTLENMLYTLKSENEMIYRGMCTKNAKPGKFIAQVKVQIEQDTDGLGKQMFLIRHQKGYLKSFVENYMNEIERGFNDFQFPF